MDTKILKKCFKEKDFDTLIKKYNIKDVEQIPHNILTNKLKIENKINFCKWLFDNNVDYNAKDNLGNTGLMIACYMKNIEFVELYLSFNANQNEENTITPLMLSLEGLVNDNIVDLLLKNNANVDVIVKYNKEYISAITLAYQNASFSLFKEIISKSKNIKKHYKLIKKLNFISKEKNKRERIIEDKINEYIHSYYEKEPLSLVKELIKKYNLEKNIIDLILEESPSKVKLIKENEYIYQTSNLRIIFTKENDEINIIDILLDEEIIYPEIKKERLKRKKENEEKIKKYNESFKIDLGYERNIGNLKIEEVKKAKEVKKSNKGKQLLFNNKKYIFEYTNENQYRQKERALKKYNMLAYKKLNFEYYESLRKGNFLGKEISINQTNKTIDYELALPTDEMFKKVHGEIILHYRVHLDKNIIELKDFTPDILLEGHRSELPTYRGVMISKDNKGTDMFKIDLLNMLNK